MRKTRLIIKCVLSLALTLNGQFFGLAVANEGDDHTPKKNEENRPPNKSAESPTLKEVDVEFTANTEEDRKKFRPSNLKEEHALSLLAFLIARSEAKNDEPIIKKLSLEGKTFKGQMGHTIKGFPVEALVFYAAIGATMVRKAYTNSFKDGKQDPRWMENFITELTSTMGILSFFAFVLASGVTSYWTRRFFQNKSITALSSARMRHAKDPTNRRVRRRYLATRFGFDHSPFIVGPLSMSMGMMASNIVHELDYIASHNEHAKACTDLLPKLLTGGLSKHLPSDQDKLACDLFYDELSGNALSWVPGLVSMVVASTLSHALVKGMLKGLTGTKEVILKGATWVPGVALSSIANKALLLIPIPFINVAARVISVAARSIKGVAQSIKKPDSLPLRFLNLYAFMEVEQEVTHEFFSYIWTDGQKSDRWEDSVSDLMLHLNNVDYNSPYRICKDEKQTDCEYHESIYTIHKTASRFNQWRQHQMMLASLAYNNWLLYVSSALNSFDFAREQYREFFKAKFNPVESELNTVLYFVNPEQEEWKTMFQGMQGIIDKELGMDKKFAGERVASRIPSLKVVSYSPSRFLKPNMPPQNRKDKLLVLRALFSAWDSNVSLEPFFDDNFSNFKREIRQEILNKQYSTVDFLTKLLDKSLSALEDNNEFLSASEEQLNNLENQLRDEEQKSPLDEDKISRLDYALYSAKSQLNEDLSKIISIDKGDKQILDSLNKLIKLRLPDDSLFFTHKQYGEIKPKMDEDFISFYLSSWDSIIENFVTRYNNAENKQAVLDDFKKYLKALKTEFLDNKLKLVDHTKLEKQVTLTLRKRVLSAGLEYLNQIVIQEKEARKYSFGAPDHHSLAVNKELKNLPKEVQSAFRFLGLDDVFAKLYRLTFNCRRSESNQIVPNSCVSLQSDTKGMDRIKINNSQNTSLYPSTLKNLHTPGAMDFLVASAVCGPDLDTKKHNNMLAHISRVKGQDSLKDVFRKELGFFGRLFNAESDTEMNMDDIVEKTPVFDRPMGGRDFKVRPPYITKNLNKNERRDICRGMHSRRGTNNIVQDIYDSRFIAGGKEYSNLLHLVLDHIALDGVSSVEGFDKWWDRNMQPYKALFMVAMDREYKRLVERWFMQPLFRNDTTEVSILECTLLRTKSYRSLLDVFQNSSQGEKYIKQIGRMCRNRDSIMYDHLLHFPVGVFENMRFEIFFWSKILLQLQKKRNKYLTENCKGSRQSSSEELENSLMKFKQHFNIGEKCAGNPDQYWLDDVLAVNSNPNSDFDKDTPNNKIQTCKKWTKSFMDKISTNKTGTNDNILTDLKQVSEALEIEWEALKEGAYPLQDSNFNAEGSSQEDIEKKHYTAMLAGFTSHYSESDECEEVALETYENDRYVARLPEQLINYTLVRLHRIMEEGINYAHQINVLSKNPEVTNATD